MAQMQLNRAGKAHDQIAPRIARDERADRAANHNQAGVADVGKRRSGGRITRSFDQVDRFAQEARQNGVEHGCNDDKSYAERIAKPMLFEIIDDNCFTTHSSSHSFGQTGMIEMGSIVEEDETRMDVIFHIKVTDFGHSRVVVLEVEVVGIGESQSRHNHAADKHAVRDQRHVFFTGESAAQIADDAMAARKIHMQVVVFLRQRFAAAGRRRHSIGQRRRANLQQFIIRLRDKFRRSAFFCRKKPYQQYFRLRSLAGWIG